MNERNKDKTLSFPPANDRRCEGNRDTCLWVNAYLNERLKTWGRTADSTLYLNKIGQNSSLLASKFRGALLGLAAGDALGTTLEFSLRDSLPAVKDIVGGGPFGLLPGQWTDDTSMALCLAASLIRKGRFDSKDQMEIYVQWWKHGVFSSNGTCFDIGNTVKAALQRYLDTGVSDAGDESPESAGNGSIMRLAPVALFNFGSPPDLISACASSSKTTHKAKEAVDACKYFGGLIFGALVGVRKDVLVSGLFTPYPGAWDEHKLSPTLIEAVTSAAAKGRSSIESSGYVLHTLQAAIWAFANSQSFEEGALLAANLGGDADTTAAVYGQLAGAFYGEHMISPHWIKKLSHFHAFYYYADQLLRFGVSDAPRLYVGEQAEHLRAMI